eukprot:Protomagalhaensia_sp_Gyna_25__4011@NODE_3614_length_511_cov_92_144068_g3057_i0_p2_GENE_NODE_3614_length_511_cov_92_144068_g3057_i0NODE_3614_length_511_cov_92_144068_g3057_i0_p2_ORF_typecomplete_len129_score26_49Cgr1/PF03879_14/1_3e14LKAAEAR/PF15478_6/0_0005LKAAEAR/PF15478_6/7_1e03GcrA/PF07750_11/0_0007DUF2477/PF10631_9/0_064Phage_GP20/PF06810_11/0_061ACP_syn_III_C/PF08541_10/0_16Adaptin_binding/PF10199_9/0_14Med21/PF11221_8/0_21DUF4140/PF13600_6/0_68FAM60A/PF15396_6/0_49AAA_23/PF13476_6/0_52DUF4
MEEPTRGAPVSGRVWKNVQTHKSSASFKSLPSKSLEQREEERNQKKRIKELESSLKAAKAQQRRQRNEQRRLNEEKKKEEEIKHAIKHQGAVYIDTRKVRKMDLKARKCLMKISTEQLQERFGVCGRR